jgi:AAA ATPase domain/Adenylate and Guanylate cyclase catalytic domain
MGDGILVYFGYPQALERDAERALRAALAIVDAMPALNGQVGHNRNVELAVRIGIATGVVVVGETVGEGAAAEKAVVGETPNLAARLQSLAQPNGIVIGSVTKDLAGDAFVCQGAHELKGITGLVKAWRVSGLKEEPEEEAEDELGGKAGRLPLVGRDEEVGLLRRAWQQVRDGGRGQVVLLAGEPGIGKSVLVDGLRAEVRAESLPPDRLSLLALSHQQRPLSGNRARQAAGTVGAGRRPGDQAEQARADGHRLPIVA